MKGLVIAVVLIVVVLVLLRSKGGNKQSNKIKRPTPKAQKTKVKPAREKTPYRATEIVCKNDACDAVKAIAGKPFLDKDHATPLIPLPECDAVKCQCSYRHRDDRRVDDGDRRLQSTLRDSAYLAKGNDNRREQDSGRRLED